MNTDSRRLGKPQERRFAKYRLLSVPALGDWPRKGAKYAKGNIGTADEHRFTQIKETSEKEVLRNTDSCLCASVTMNQSRIDNPVCPSTFSQTPPPALALKSALIRFNLRLTILQTFASSREIYFPWFLSSQRFPGWQKVN